MLQKKYASILNNIFLIFVLLVLFSSVNGYYAGYFKVNVNEQFKTETFNIDKVENYTYKITYVHYGNIQEGMYAKISLNGNSIKEYSKDYGNLGSGNYKKSEEVDITNYLLDGKNELTVESNIWETMNSSPYYVMDNVKISEPPLKLPISLEMNFLTLILCFLFLKRYTW